MTEPRWIEAETQPCLRCLSSGQAGHAGHVPELPASVLLPRSWRWVSGPQGETDDHPQRLELIGAHRDETHSWDIAPVATAALLFAVPDQPGTWLFVESVGEAGSPWLNLVPTSLERVA